MKRYLFCLIFCIAAFCAAAQDTAIIKPGLLFNIQNALIVNRGVSNIEYSKLNPNVKNPGYGYFQDQSKIVNFGYSGSFELIFGKNPRLKPLLGLTYDLTNSAFYYDVNYRYQDGHSGIVGDSAKIHYDRMGQWVGIYCGTMFPIYRKFSLCFIFGYSQSFWRRDIKNGYEVNYGLGNWLSPGWSTLTNYANTKDMNKGEGSGFSFYLRLRACYKINSTFTAFASGNISFVYAAPWFMLGLQYYPFKKLR